MWKTQAQSIMKIGALTLLLLILGGLGATAEAACTSPAGVAGQMQWIAPNVKYCNGTSWVAMDNTATGTACSKAGEVSYVSSEIMYCNGSVWVKTSPNVNHGSCTGTPGGKFYYDTGGTFYWFCNGSNWRRMAP